MPSCPAADIVNGVTPLECHGWGVHPRLYLTAAGVAQLRSCLDRPPWSGFLARTRSGADQGLLPHAALLWLLTDETGPRDVAVAAIERALTTTREAGFSTLHSLALAYDWLYHDLSDDLRRRVAVHLDERARATYVKLALHEIYEADTYCWNVAMHSLADCALPAFAIYGEVPNVAPWLRFVLEKTRVVTAALGPDGVSPEGICYGGFFADFYLRIADLVRTHLGWDPCRDNDYLRQLPRFYLYSSLPDAHRAAGNVHLHFGDSVRGNWYGPDYFLRRIASLYRDPVAQAAADRLTGDGLSSLDGTFFNLLWYDPTVSAGAAADMPLTHHFSDQDLVIMRSGWDGDESVFGFHCGPHAGHHALRNYPQCIGGGHMAPEAGSFQLFGHGDWLINDAGYAWKQTAYRNTVLVNGIGQTGEGGEWFECTQLRLGQRAPAIARVDSHDDWVHVVGDAAAAYEPAAGLQRFRRHIVYLRPHCWILVDELVAAAPATFELLFHAWERPFEADRPFADAGPQAWVSGGRRGVVRIASVAPPEVVGSAGLQQVRGIGVHRDRDLCVLRLANAVPAANATFVTMLEACAVGVEPTVSLQLAATRGGLVLHLRTAARQRAIALSLAADPPAAAREVSGGDGEVAGS